VLGPVAGLFQRRSWGRTPRLCGFAAPRAGADVRGAHTGERAFPIHATGLRTGDHPSRDGITPPAGSSALPSLHSFQHARVRLHSGATTLAVAKHPTYYTRTNTRSHGAPPNANACSISSLAHPNTRSARLTRMNTGQYVVPTDHESVVPTDVESVVPTDAGRPALDHAPATTYHPRRAAILVRPRHWRSAVCLSRVASAGRERSHA
jgi:hypothetical protein